MAKRDIQVKLCGGILVAAMSLAAQSVSAADLTMTSGFFQKSSTKIDGSNKGSTSLFSLGARYMDDLTAETSWIGETSLKMRSYSASGGVPSPDDSVGLSITGGVRYYFKPFAESVVPYVSGIATVVSDSTASWTATGYKQTATSGLYYGANAGIRAGLGGDFFVELELPFFESPLFAVAKTETVSQVGGVSTTSKEENTETALYVSSSARLLDARVGIGMKL